MEEATATYSGAVETEAEGDVWNGGFNCSVIIKVIEQPIIR